MYCMTSSNVYGFTENGYYFQRTGGRPLSSKLHSHDFYEFLFIISGKCTHERNGIEEAVSEGDLIFIAPWTSHRFLSQSENTDVTALSVISAEMNIFLDMYGLNELFDKSFVFKLSIEKYRVLIERCESLTFESNEKYITQLRMLLNQIFLFATELEYKKSPIPSGFAEIMKKMNTLENASEGISAFLRLSGYSHSQLCRLTGKYLGLTPTEYVNKLRLSYAYDMIVYGSDDYETICEAVGFASFSYFCKLLKKNFGCTAAKLRKGTGIMRKTL